MLVKTAISTCPSAFFENAVSLPDEISSSTVKSSRSQRSYRSNESTVNSASILLAVGEVRRRVSRRVSTVIPDTAKSSFAVAIRKQSQCAPSLFISHFARSSASPKSAPFSPSISVRAVG